MCSFVVRYRCAIRCVVTVVYCGSVRCGTCTMWCEMLWFATVQYCVMWCKEDSRGDQCSKVCCGEFYSGAFPKGYLYLKHTGMLFVWLTDVNFGCLVSLRVFLGKHQHKKT